MAMTEDLSGFLDTKEFADTATLDGAEVTGIVMSGMDNLTFDGPGPAGSSPSFMLSAANVPAKPEGKTLVITSGIAAGAYKVSSQEPDGTGMVILRLN